LDGILEGLGYVSLADDLFKRLGAIFSCQYQIGHDGKVPFTIGS